MSFNALQGKIDEIKTGSDLSFYSLTGGANNKIIGNNRLYREGWLCNEDVYAVVSRLASLVSSLPIKLMNGEEIADPATDEFAKFFYSEWNKKRGLRAELHRVILNVCVYGRAYTYKKESEDEIIGFGKSELWTLNTKFVNPCSTGNYDYFENPDYYTLTNGSKQNRIYPEELIIVDNANLETSNFDEYISPMQSVFNTVTSENNRSNAESVMLSNRGIAGFISPKATSGDSGLLGFNSKVMDAIRTSFSKLTGGSEKFNKVEVVEKASEFTQLGMSASDLKIVEMRLNHVRSICNAYNVPSLLFNDYQSRTHANYETALKAMYSDAIIPLYKKWESQFTKDFLISYNKKNKTKYSLKLSMDEIEALNRSVSDVFRSLNPQIANRFLDNMSESDIKALLIDLGLTK